jgi:protein TonB
MLVRSDKSSYFLHVAKIFSKYFDGDFFRESFAPVTLISLVCHILVFSSILFLTKALYKSKEFERPYTFELVKLRQIFDIPSPAKPASVQKRPAVTQKPAVPRPVMPEPIKEQNPVPSEQKSAPEPASAPQTQSAPQQTTSAPGPAGPAAPASETGADVNKIYEDQTVDEIPVCIKKISPFYPEFVKDQGISGTVKAQVIIDENGAVMQIKILSSPHELLSEEVCKAVSRWKYKPGRFKGTAVKVRTKPIEVTFELKD